MKYFRGLKKLYYQAWLKLCNLIAHDNPFEIADTVLVNSRFIARVVKILWNGEPTVLHLPVDVKRSEKWSLREFDDIYNAIAMIDRIANEKRLRLLLMP